jgi:CRISPR type IV-associated protein Csf3
MVNLKVTIDLSNPMMEPGDLLHLDALLGALRVSRARAEHGDAINPRDYHYDLPLERYQAPSGDWVFKASAFKLKRQLPNQMWMQTGRLSIVEAARHRQSGFLQLRAGKPNPAGGPFKTSIYHRPIVQAELTAFCVGDQQGIEALLSECRQIGGKRGVGFGQVAGFKVEPVAETDCPWSWRALPADADPRLVTSEHARCIAAIRGPYWDRTLHVEALAPTP